MKSLLTILILGCLILSCDGRKIENTNTYEKTDYGVKIELDSSLLEVQFYSPSIVRVIKAPEVNFDKESLAVIKNPESVTYKVDETDNEISLTTEDLRVGINKNSGAISYESVAGRPLLKEKAGSTKFKPFLDVKDSTYSVSQTFELDAEEAIYGLGILQNGKMSQRNQEVRMVQNNTWDFVPFFQSVKGYGLFWDNYSPTVFKDDENGTQFSSEVGDAIDYYFMYGGSADAVVSEMRELTGDVPMFPLWTYGFWQSRERYKSQVETAGVVKKYRELGVPLDGIIQDWQYWGDNYHWNAMEFLNPDFPNPQKLVDEVHDMNAHMIISVWSSFGPETSQYKVLKEKDMLMDFQTWPQSGKDTWPPDMDYPSGVRVYDAYDPEARDIYWEHLRDGLFSLGIDGWWMDSTEPDHLDFKPEDFDNETYLGSFRKVRNAYPLVTVGGVYKHQRELTSEKRVFILTRSGFAGQQRYGANVWSGDLGSSWESLRNQLPAALNFTLTGNPNFNSDIGGFFAGDYNATWNDGTASKNPLFQELYVRWLQFGAFNPMMRSHGTDLKREIYYFGKRGEPIYDAIAKTIEFRYSLLPYIYSTSWQVTNNQDSFMKALVMDFPEDEKVWDLGDQFMFGDSFLVAPVLEAHYTPEKIVKVDEEEGWNKTDSKESNSEVNGNFTETKSAEIYLPEGSKWVDYWTGDYFDGGQQIEKETTINTIPLYVKAGSIIPVGPNVQYATEKSWDDLEMKIYTGADGEFVLYEDEFDNYNYEDGIYSTIKFSWDESSNSLKIGKRDGSFPGMLKDRKFKLVKISEGKQSLEKEINYSGEEEVVKFD